ncbi:MAG: alpha/beta hydrolase [Bacteroidota bacterium]
MFLEIDGVAINYQWINKEYLTNNEPIIIFLHQGLGCIGQWNDFPIKLSGMLQIPALIYDRYGHGKSSGIIEDKYSLDYLNKEAFFYLPKIIETLKITNSLILYGHSDGGTIAMLYAANYFQKVKVVVTESAHVFNEPIVIKGIQNNILNFEHGNLKNQLEKYHGQNTDKLFYRWAKSWTDTNASKWNITDQIEKIETPVLAIQGDMDEYASTDQIKMISNSVSGFCKTYVIPDCGHFPHINFKDKVLELSTTFINHVNYKSII